jgi:acyl-CoA synthetase (AMP-forming)/AMP-acid ligase II
LPQQQGVEADDRVAIKLLNTSDYVAAYFSAPELRRARIQGS